MIFHHQNTWGYQEDSMAFMITTSGLPDNNLNNREKKLTWFIFN